MPAEPAAARAEEMDADTVSRELTIARKAIGWWQRQGWIEGDMEDDPAIGIERRSAPSDRTRALSHNQDHRLVAPGHRLGGGDAMEDALRKNPPPEPVKPWA
jgi:integrase/recombinase XerD